LLQKPAEIFSGEIISKAYTFMEIPARVFSFQVLTMKPMILDSLRNRAESVFRFVAANSFIP
jgi:hypothetical protein